MRGELGIEQDPKEGVRILRLAADGGEKADPAALYELSWCWEKGVPAAGMLKSEEMAFSMLSQAAVLGYPQAQGEDRFVFGTAVEEIWCQGPRL